MEKIDYKKLLIFIFGTYLIGGLFSFFIDMPSMYQELNKPFLSPPGYVFPIVWTVLYTLMGISLYLVSEESGDKKKSYIIYIVQLILNSLWTLFYFGLDMKLFAFIILIGLIISVIIMNLEFIKLNKTAAYLQIPYLIWLIFAGYLNLSTYLLNM